MTRARSPARHGPEAPSRLTLVRWVVLPSLGCLALAACRDTPPEPPRSPGEALAGLSTGERGRFLLGRALFERLATADEGLGPLYNQERCSDCHDQPAVGGSGTQRVRVLKATRFADGRCDLLHAEGGDNIQRRATDLLVAHGMGPEEVPAAATATALMTAPSLLGLGLIEAVPDTALAERADPDDLDGDGISGRLPRLPDGRTARFGRKGDASTLEDFVDTALRFELGFTTPGHPAEEPRNGVPVPAGADPMPDPEIDAPTLRHLTEYVRFLAPPAPAPPPAGAAGDTLAPRRGAFRPDRLHILPPTGAADRLVRFRHPVTADVPALLRSAPARPGPRARGRVRSRTPPPANFARLPSGAFGTATAFCTTAEQRMCRPRSRRTAGKRRVPATPSSLCRTMPGARSFVS